MDYFPIFLRIAGEPVARIIGDKEFWSLTLHLSPETLVPRPDTETVVSAALAWARRGGRQDEGLTILDLGTGTGAILLALLSELPAATGVGVDITEGAARTARDNARRLGLAGRAQFVVADWTAAIGPLVYYPFITLGLMLLARSPLLANWDLPLGLYIVFGLTAGYTAAAAYTLRRAAERTRRFALDDLGRQIMRATGRSGQDAFVNQLALLRAGLRSRPGPLLPPFLAPTP